MIYAYTKGSFFNISHFLIANTLKNYFEELRPFLVNLAVSIPAFVKHSFNHRAMVEGPTHFCGEKLMNSLLHLQIGFVRFKNSKKVLTTQVLLSCR